MSDLQPSNGRGGLRGAQLNPDIMQAAGARHRPAADRPILGDISNKPSQNRFQPSAKPAGKASQRQNQPKPHADARPKPAAQPAQQAEEQPVAFLCGHIDCYHTDKAYPTQASLNAHMKSHKKKTGQEEDAAQVICLELAIQVTAGVNANAKIHQRNVSATVDGQFVPGVIVAIKDIMAAMSASSDCCMSFTRVTSVRHRQRTCVTHA